MIHSSAAKRYRLRVQVVGVVLLALTGTLVALPVSEMLTPRLPEPAAPVGEEGAEGEEVVDEPVRLGGVAAVLERLGGEVEARVAVTEPVDEGPEAEPEKPEPEPGLRFLGTIVGPRAAHALLEVRGKQHLVAEGGEADGVRLVSVRGGYVMIDDGSGERRLDRAEQGVTWATGDPPVGEQRRASDHRRDSASQQIRDRVRAAHGEVVELEEESEGGAAPRATPERAVPRPQRGPQRGGSQIDEGNS